MRTITTLILFVSTFLAYGQNNLPFIAAADIPAPGTMCLGQNVIIYENLGITDIDLDEVSILSVQSSNQTVLDPANIGFTLVGINGNISYFNISGIATVPGTVVLSIEVSDGTDVVTLPLPSFNVTLLDPPVFNTQLISLCSNQGLVDLNDFLSSTYPDGTFSDSGQEVNFENGVFDTGDTDFPTETIQTLSYEVYTSSQCFFEATVPLTLHVSPTVNIASTATACAQSTGTATATVTGGASPYGMSQWSSGEQNTTAVNNLAAGQYAFTIVDANACQVNSYFTIATTGTDVIATIQDVTCHGENTGSINLTPVGMLAPVKALWSSGHSTSNLTAMPAGNYTVQLTDAAGCLLTRTLAIGQPDPLKIDIGATWPSCGATDGSVEVYTTQGGVGPYTYAWSNGGTGTLIQNIGWGTYTFTLTDANGCTAVETVYVSEYGGADLAGNVTGANCGIAEGGIDVTAFLPFGQTVSSIQWSNGATTEDIENVLPELYICTLVTSSNCTALGAWDIPVVAPLKNEICVVTVDSATTTNLVVWEKVQTQGVAYYNIYRETSVQGDFALIDTVHAANLSLFNDVVASPLSRSWRYKISAVNACGIESPLSVPHQTIHLDVLNASGTSVNINWNAYQGAAFSNYIISRYTDAAGWEPVATVPSTQLSYNDPIAFTTPGLDYVVEMELDETCTALVYRAQDFNSSRSNKDKGQFLAGSGTGNSSNGVDELNGAIITLYPNPFNELLTVHIESASKALNMGIYSIDGKLIRTTTLSNGTHQLDLSPLKSGMYFIKTGSSEKLQQIIKQ